MSTTEWDRKVQFSSDLVRSKIKPFTILRQTPVMLSGWNLSFDLYFPSSVLKAFYCFQKDKIFPLKSDIILPSNNKNCLSSNISTNLWGILSPTIKRNISCDHLDIDIRLSKDWLDLKLITNYKNIVIKKKVFIKKVYDNYFQSRIKMLTFQQ